MSFPKWWMNIGRTGEDRIRAAPPDVQLTANKWPKEVKHYGMDT